jgi:hypothetical protein
MLGNQTVKAGFTTDSAQGIAHAKAQQIAQQNADAAGTTPAQETNVTFNQYNNSPKALSDIDIYRQTNNQISKAKGVLVYANTGSSD